MTHISLQALHVLNGLAIICTAVVFGTDVFFALVGKKAAATSKESSIEDLLGHIHAVADVRMPFVGITAVLTTILQVVFYGVHDLAGQLAMLALAGLLVQLLLYLTVAKPVNTAMVQAVKYGRELTNVRELQQRWDKVITWRGLSLSITDTGCLILDTGYWMLDTGCWILDT